jgi:hypothetical protein
VTGAAGANDSRERQNVDALITDRYLDSILAAHARGADAGPLEPTDLPAPDIRRAAQRLARDLARFHPSFRFEEALAAKLAEAAARMRLPMAAGGEASSGSVVRLTDAPTHLPDDEQSVAGEDPGSIVGRELPGGRELLIGGALTSAALSIAGAAYVAWRIRHPQSSPMARAVRAVARARLA